MRILAKQIALGFPAEKQHMPVEIKDYWDVRHSLNVVNGVVLYNDRIVIPHSLRKQVIENLHSAHQGVTSMTSRAMSTVFWPGITSAIEEAREGCRTCHRNAPSQPKLPPVNPKIPTVPFQMICSDYFKLGGYFYLVTIDRLSSWSEVAQVKAHSGSSGAKGLCQALRQLFSTFSVPEEISSDGGPEFTAGESKDFYRRWGIRHRLSSAYFPQSNGRAELAVKATKRLLEDNTGTNGELNTDKVVCALLQQRNTPDRDCGLSPAEILFARPLRDGLPQINKSKLIHNKEDLRSEWRKAWAAKEDAIRSRLVRNCEKLEAHSRELEPLREGDSVMIQNQNPSSHRSKKWDRQGTVVATGENDQYLVRVAGSGRLTLRNRRFLRKFQEQTGHDSIESVHRSPTIPLEAGEAEVPLSTTTPLQCATPIITRDSAEVGGDNSSHPGLEESQISTGTPQEPGRVSSGITDSATVNGGGNMISPMQATDHVPTTPRRAGGRPRGPARKTLRKQQLIRNLKARVVVQEDPTASAENHAERPVEGMQDISQTSTPCLRRSERLPTTRNFYNASTGQ